MPYNARFMAAPLPVLLHVLGAATFCVMGAFQFLSSFRRRRPAWPRVSGRVLVPCGLVAGLSGLWMTPFYPIDPLLQGGLLMTARLAAGAGMVVSIVRAVGAMGRRDIGTHRAWMVRGYALAQGSGTQVLVRLSCSLLAAGPLPTGLTRDALMGLAWLINLAVAEWLDRRPPRPPPATTTPPALALAPMPGSKSAAPTSPRPTRCHRWV